ncbi:MAG: hypothetical protein N2Z72_03710 [Bacteroidales bacterium]|nr:hypothetical protein [Bacteroidales bacterium]
MRKSCSFCVFVIGVVFFLIAGSEAPGDSSENIKARQLVSINTQHLYHLPLGYSSGSNAIFCISFQDGIVSSFYAVQKPFRFLMAPIVQGQLIQKYLSTPEELSTWKGIEGKFIVSIIEDNNADLYVVRFSNGSFSTPEKLSFNSPYNEVMGSFNSDGMKIYFSSNRPGGYGGYDIYETEWDGKKWTEPRNLGAPINSAGDEVAPFLLKDGVTLYFSTRSDAKKDFDIYVSTFSDENVSWEVPEPLSFPVNTKSDDLFFRMSPDESRAIYCSEGKEGYGIYELIFN